MDPNETLKIFVAALEDFDLDTAGQAFNDLGDRGFHAGGHQPTIAYAYGVWQGQSE